MSRELRWVLILFVLMIVIWGLVLGSRGSSLQIVLLLGAIWATVDFGRALWGMLHAPREDEEPFA